MGNVMLITGGNKGIGYHMIKKWLENGNKAAVIDICCSEVEKLKKLYHQRLITFVCDVADKESVQECIDTVIHQFNAIDIAVHNACKCVFKNITDHSLNDYKRTYEVNFLGAVNITKAVLPYMKERKKGKICYLSSGVGVTGYINISGYATSKGAIESLAKCMLLENLNTGVTFHILHPPLTDTESSAPLPIPKEFKADPKKVGEGFIKRINKNSFIITPSFFDTLTVRMSYWFPRFTGKMLVNMTNKVNKNNRK